VLEGGTTKIIEPRVNIRYVTVMTTIMYLLFHPEFSGFTAVGKRV
jgi:hypothetical protein